MTIAIVGSGNMGSNLARLLAAKGQQVAIGHKDPAKAEALAAELGPHARGGNVAFAAGQADTVVLAVPFGAVADALREAGDLAGKVLMDITNPITPDYMALTIGHTTSAAEEIQKLAPGARVVKALNTVFWQLLPFEARRGRPPVQVFLAGDDPAAKQRVAGLAALLEFEPVDAGPLRNARYVEPMAELNIHLGYALGWGTAIAPGWTRLAAAAEAEAA